MTENRTGNTGAGAEWSNVGMLRLIDTMSVDALKETVIDVFGAKLCTNIYEWVLSVLEAKYDCKIISSRKTYVLFRIFTQIIMADLRECGAEYAQDMFKNIFTDIYIYGLDKRAISDILYGKQVLVADAVMMHGDRLSKMVDYLQISGANRVAVCTFAENIEAKAMTQDLADCMANAAIEIEAYNEGTLYFYNSTYKKSVVQVFSSSIVELAQRTNSAYSEIVNTYGIEGKVQADYLKRLYGFDYSYDIQNTSMQRYTKVWSEILVDGTMFAEMVDKSRSDFDKIRFLTEFKAMLNINTCAGKYQSVTSMVLMPMMNMELLQKCWENACAGCNAALGTSVVEMNDEVEMERQMIYRYKWLSYNVADSFLRGKADGALGITDNCISLYNREHNSDTNFYEIVERTIAEFVTSVDTDGMRVYDKPKVFEVWTETGIILKNVLYKHKILSVDSLCDALLDYIDSVNKENEERIAKGWSRLKGISIHNMFGLLYDVVQRNNISMTVSDWAHVIGFLKSLNDSGIIEYTVEAYYIYNTYWVDGCITEGTEAYRAVFENECYADYLVGAQILTQSADSVLIGVERLSLFENKLNSLHILPDNVDFGKIREYYIQNGGFDAVTETLRMHRPSEVVNRVLYSL